MKDLFNSMTFLTQDTFKKYIGKTIEDIRYEEYIDDYPNDVPAVGMDMIIKFTDGTQCLFGRIDFVVEGN